MRKTAIGLILVLTACSEQPTPATDDKQAEVAVETPAAEQAIERNPDKNAYFGDLHVHTRLSFDAFLFGTRTGPDESYAFAKGGEIEHAAGFSVQMKKPLDFQAVTDHGTYLGMLPQMMQEGTSVSDHPIAKDLRASYQKAAGRAAFQGMLPYIGGQVEEDDLLDLEIVRSAWAEIAAAAERHNDPGTFTTFIGYEYTSSGPEFQNLHRNVIFAGAEVPDLPFTRLDSVNPEDLWQWMDAQRDEGMDAIAIPHNSNGSDGWMFQTTNWAGEPIDAAYAEQRMRNEPIVEVTQVKGTSDTHPLLSPNDEWADFEIMPWRVATQLDSQPDGSYVRQAYRNGLAIEARTGVNPFQFGLIGASDTHNSAGSFEEDNYWSKTGVLDDTPEERGSIPLEVPGEDGETYSQGASQYWGASGLAGLWAESNTRADLHDAMKRKETFATSGPHIRVRFFAGFDLPADILSREDAISAAYAGGVTMGGDLLARTDEAPTFFAWASRDADTQPLQRLQIIKGWLDDAGTREQVFDIACSGGAKVDPATNRCPDNGATVDLTSCATQPGSGAAELATTWRDPNFDPAQRAFYYVRVLENPSCRWSTWDAIRNNVSPRPDMKQTIQDRAWSSPIWFVPG